MSKELVIQNQTLSVEPEDATIEARRGAVQLKQLLDQKPKPIIIKGKRHIEFEDWIALGEWFGVGVKTYDAEPVEIFDAKGFKARADLIDTKTGTVIGGADAYCLNNETNWKNKDYFQMASMAQTRAGSKALSNKLRWVVALEGIAGTPAEEMNSGVNRGKPKKVVKRVNKKKPQKTVAEPVVDGEFKEKKDDDVEINKESLAKACKTYPLIRVLIKSLKQDGVPITEENIRNELIDDERIPSEMVTKIMEIING